MPVKIINAREAAYKALARVRKNGAYSDAALNSVLITNEIEDRDAALASRIFYGVVQNQALIDYYISAFLSVKTSKLEPQVLDILRLSVYQLVFLSKIPVNAAVHEGVELAKKHANPRASGLVNAVLRKIAANINQLPSINGSTAAEILSVRYSHPIMLTEVFIKQFGEENAAALLEANNKETALTINVNTLKADAQTVVTKLQADHVEISRHPWLENCLELRNTHQIERLSAYKDGLFYVQDPAAILSVTAAAPQKGMFIVDGCAAPGGKSFAAALATMDTGRILACDINEKKLLRVTEGAGRLGFRSIETKVMNALEPNGELNSKADIVLADVPCSGFGVIRKKPEIRYKPEREIQELPELQLRILENLSRYVKPGGMILYSTCTLLQRENEDVIKAFLHANSGFILEAFRLPGPIGDVQAGMTTLFPHIHGTDGFFICRLRRVI